MCSLSMSTSRYRYIYVYLNHLYHIFMKAVQKNLAIVTMTVTCLDNFWTALMYLTQILFSY